MAGHASDARRAPRVHVASRGPPVAVFLPAAWLTNSRNRQGTCGFMVPRAKIAMGLKERLTVSGGDCARVAACASFFRKRRAARRPLATFKFRTIRRACDARSEEGSWENTKAPGRPGPLLERAGGRCSQRPGNRIRSDLGDVGTRETGGGTEKLSRCGATVPPDPPRTLRRPPDFLTPATGNLDSSVRTRLEPVLLHFPVERRAADVQPLGHFRHVPAIAAESQSDHVGFDSLQRPDFAIGGHGRDAE